MKKELGEMLKECDKCEGRDSCEVIKKLKIILAAVEDIDKATSRFKLKANIAIILEAVVLAIWLFLTFLTTNRPPFSYFLFITLVFVVLTLYIYSVRNKYMEEQIKRLEVLGNAIGISEERQKEMRRCMEGKKTSIAEKMMNCKLRKKHGSNYCVKCPDSYDCASLKDVSNVERVQNDS